MSEAPSWLTEENISTAAKVTQNPAAQKAAVKVAKNKEVQKAVKAEVNKSASSNAPTWATSNEGTYTPPGDVESNNNSARQPSTASDNNRSSDFVIEEQVLKDMQRWHLALRILYMSAAILMAAAAVLAFENANSNIGVAFFAIYTIFFAVMICCFEFALNVGFVLYLYSMINLSVFRLLLD